MNVDSLALIQAYHPRSFHERGLAAPFTTPLLAGGRLRRTLSPEVVAGERVMTRLARGVDAADPTAVDTLSPVTLELLVPNPSGGRGVYILPWSDVSGLCRPTMHDVCLGQTLTSRITLTQEFAPTTLRQAARDVALQGLAGRPAARAAQAALDMESHLRMEIRSALWLALIAAVEPGSGGGSPQESPAELEQRGFHALSLLGERLRAAPAVMMERMDHVTDCFVEIGLSDASTAAWLPRLLAELRQMRGHLLEWSQTQAEHGLSETSLRQLSGIVTALERTMAMTQATQIAARMRLRDMAGLFLHSPGQPDEIAALSARPLWIIDGWEQICLLWLTAYTVPERTRTIRDMAALVPMLPDEAETWLSLPAGTSARLNQRGPAPGGVGVAGIARGGVHPIDRIARNEQIRALAG